MQAHITHTTAFAGGKGANQAVAAAKVSALLSHRYPALDTHSSPPQAGASVDFAGCIGDDGLWLRDTLNEYGVGTDCLAVDSSLPTGRALIQLSTATSDNSIVLLKGSNFSATDPTPSKLGSYSHLLLQNEIPLAATQAICVAAHKAGLQTVWNPSPMPSADELAAFPWQSLRWLLLNEGEAGDLLEIMGGDPAVEEVEDLVKGLQGVRQLKGVGLVVTCGSRGVLATGVEGIVHSGAGEVKGGVADTTGAGDCFTVSMRAEHLVIC